jgi:SAM-dependent methyltransferase
MLGAIRAFPSFVSDYRKFRSGYSGAMQVMPYLHDKTAPAGETNSEYFVQDLFVARRIYDRNPAKHVDVGSRIDGFVAHVASFRTIEVIDIRAIKAEIPGILFRQADLTNIDHSQVACCDSLSCLHALEHIGLGRYGDSIDPLGWKQGLANLSRLVRTGGRLYLSTPIGKEKVFFNAHRVFPPAQLIESAQQHGLKLDHFSWFADGKLTESSNIGVDVVSLTSKEYSLGIFEFMKE